MADTPGIESYPEYLARKGDPRDAAADVTVVVESYPDYLARKAAGAEPKQVKGKDTEDKAVKASGAEGK